MPELAIGANRRRASSAACSARLRLPLNDPFAVFGLAIYAIFVLTAIFADQIAPYDPTGNPLHARLRPRRRPAARPGRLHPRHHQPRPRYLLPDRLRNALGAADRRDGRLHGGADRFDRRAGLRLFRRLGGRRADAARRHRLRHPVPALRDRAGSLPRSRRSGTWFSPWRWCCGATPAASSAARC